MALSNRDRIDRMFQVLAPALDDFISSIIGQAGSALGADWTRLVQSKDLKNGVPAAKSYDALDPQVQFRILTEGNITARRSARPANHSRLSFAKSATTGHTMEPSPTMTPIAHSTLASVCSSWSAQPPKLRRFAASA